MGKVSLVGCEAEKAIFTLQQHPTMKITQVFFTVKTPSERSSRASRELIIDYPKQRLQKVTRQQTIPTRIYDTP